jgi:protein required for attachment to host cells
MSDRPGSAGNGGASGSHSAVAYKTDPVDFRERKFVENLAAMLDTKHAEGAFQRLIIAAAPQALGDLRPALSEAVRSTILAELPKDLTNIPTDKLASHFDGLIAV